MSFKLRGTKYRIGLRLAVVASITKEGETNPLLRQTATGFAVANPQDIFNPAIGAKLAVSRALKIAFNKCERRAIWPQITGKVEKKGREVFNSATDDYEIPCRS